MNELQRQAYMEAMGVDCYMPRLHLPGAAVSEQCALPELAVATTVSSPVTDTASAAPATTVAPTASSGASESTRAIQALFEQPSRAEVLAQSRSAGSSASIDEAVGFIQSAAAKKQAVPRFHLSILRSSNIMLIDDAIPGHINPDNYRQLLQNVLFALGMGKQPLMLDAFAWPMINNSQIDQSQSAAIQTLEAFLGKQVEQDSIAYLILMGNTATQYLNLEPVADTGLGKHARLPLQFVHIHSAGLMLDQPSLKPQAWQQLQPLYRALQAGSRANT